MRYLVTGASGWIGSAATRELLAAGHDVVGLARSDDAAAKIEALGADVARGTIDEPEGVAKAAAGTDGVVHLGYHHDFAQMTEAAAIDRAVIDAVGAELAGSDRPLLIAAGTLGLAVGRVGTEDDRPAAGGHPRIANSAAALAWADRGVRAIVARFAPTVHGAGDHGFVARLVQIARDTGVSAYIGDGANRWPAVHRFDAGTLVQLSVDNSPAGSVIHAVAEEGVATRDIAAAIGTGLGLPVESIAPDDAPAHFDWLAGFFGADVPASNTITRERLGWTPTHPTLLADLEAGSYFSR